MSKETCNIFSYGTLQDTAVQKAVFRRELKGSVDILNDYELLSDQVYGSYPVVAPKEGVHTRGYCYRLNPDELKLADAYEGPGYIREEVTLHSGTRAWVYLENKKQL